MTNQRISILRGAIAAAAVNACYVLPHIYADYESDLFSWDSIEFSVVFNHTHFADFAAAKGLGVVRSLPAKHVGRCLDQLSHNRQANLDVNWLSKSRVKQILHTNKVLCLNAEPAILYLKDLAPDAAIGEWFDALQPSEHFAKLATEGIAKLRIAKPGAKVYGVHARLEEDWQRGCSKGLQVEQKALGLECYVNESSIAAFLLEHGVAKGAMLYVSTGLSRQQFPTLCTMFQCLFKQDVAVPPWHLLSLFARSTIAAYLDALVLESTDEFFGNRYSTFSAFIDRQMRAKGKPASYYNKPRLQKFARTQL
jgi:hypothetical protein